MKTVEDLNISEKHKRQLGRARQRRSNQLYEKVLVPSIIAYADGNVSALPHLFSKEEGNFAHSDFAAMLDRHDGPDGQLDWASLQTDATLFTNPLTEASFNGNNVSPGQRSGYTPPSERVANGSYWVLTYEFDGDTRQDLEMQLDWFTGKAETSPFASVHAALSTFADYRGYSAVYSGSKSVHINIVFDIRHLSKSLSAGSKGAPKRLWTADVPEAVLPDLHRLVWSQVAEIITDKLGITVEFDTRLKSYFQKRRSPWGVRTLNKPNSLHGFEVGDRVEQIVLQEKISDRSFATKNAVPLIHSNNAEHLLSARRSSTNRPSRHIVPHEDNHAIVDLLATHLQSHWGPYPKPAHVTYDGMFNFVYFYNSANDKHPSTFVRGDHRKLICAGRDAYGGDLFLPDGLTLDETLQLLDPRTGLSGFAEPNGKPQRGPHPLRRFEEQAQSKSSARQYGKGIFEDVANSDGVTLMQAPEGLGKTFSLMNYALERRYNIEAALYQASADREAQPHLPNGFTIVACNSYAQAEEKYAELMDVPNAPSSAIILKSVAQIYLEALKDHPKLKQITRQSAGAASDPSLLHAIQRRQPSVFEQMCRIRDAMWETDQRGKVFRPNAVVLAVHALIKNWPHSLYAKAFLHPDFPNDFDIEQVQACARQMQPQWLIYDEVHVEDLAMIQPEWKVQLAKKVEDKCGSISNKAWDEAGLSNRVASYEREFHAHGRSENEFTFDECDNIIRTRFADDDRYEVDCMRFPFGKGSPESNIYAQCHGDAYYCKPQRWFTSLNCPIVILTTEDLPRAVMNGIKGQLAIGRRVKTINMTQTPHLFQEVVPLVFDERARSPRDSKESVVDMAVELIDLGFDYVIGNRLDDLKEVYPGQTMSHKAARGRNDLADKQLATLVTYPSTTEYAHYAIFGAAFDIENPLAMAYRDQVYQDLGRNLGFRRTDESDDRHVVFIKSSLFKELGMMSGTAITGVRHDRYQFRLTKWT